MNNITGVVITLNESARIAECIENLKQVCSEIIVVDSNSKDDTREIAEKLGAKVIVQDYLGDGFQKNVGLDYASNDWVLSLDADERLMPEMVEAIKALDLSKTDHDAYAFRRRNYIGDRWIKQCGWYPDYCTRLYNRRLTKFAEVKQHAYVPAKNLEKIEADIIHNSFHSIHELFGKSGRSYARRSAKIIYAKGKKVSAWSPFLLGLNSFIRKYIIQRGFLEGVDGFTVSMSAAVSSYLKYALVIEFQRDESVTKAADFDKIW